MLGEYAFNMVDPRDLPRRKRSAQVDTPASEAADNPNKRTTPVPKVVENYDAETKYGEWFSD
jgi:hypothetical protein